MLPEILCIVKQQNQAQYDFVKLEINSVLSYSLLVRAQVAQVRDERK